MYFSNVLCYPTTPREVIHKPLISRNLFSTTPRSIMYKISQEKKNARTIVTIQPIFLLLDSFYKNDKFGIFGLGSSFMIYVTKSWVY